MLLSTQLGLGQYHFRTLDDTDGISSNVIIEIIEDSHGYIWIGTINGLNRYDGARVRVFRPNENDSTTISISSIQSIAEDANGMIWLGGKEGVLNVYNPTSDKFKVVKLPHHKSTRNDYIKDILVDDRNNVWVVMYQHLFLLEDRNLGPIRFDLGKMSSAIDTSKLRMTSIVQDKEDKNIYWVSSESGGLIKLNHKLNNLQFYHSPDGVSIGNVYQHSNGCIYSKSRDSIVLEFNPYSEQWKSFIIHGEKPTLIYSIIGISDSELLVGTRNQSLIKINIKSGSVLKVLDYPRTRYKLGNPYVSSLLLDSRNNIWIGTQYDGIKIIPNYSRRFKHWILPASFYEKYLNGRTYDEVYVEDLYELNNDEILISVFKSSHLFKSNNDLDEVKVLKLNKPLSEVNYYSFHNVSNIFGVWSNYGFIRVDTINDKLYLGKDYLKVKQWNIQGIVDTMDNKYWFIAPAINSVASYDPVTDHLEVFKDTTKDCALIQTRPKCNNRMVWYAEKNGIKKLDPRTKQIEFYRFSELLNKEKTIFVRTLDFKDDSTLIIGARGYGIALIDICRMKIIKKYTPAMGLLSNNIRMFFMDDNNRLFYGGYTGLGIIDLDRNIHYGYVEKDGLLNDAFGWFYRKGVQLHLGGYGHFTILSPSDFPAKHKNLKIRFESISIAKDKVINSLHDRHVVELAPHENFISIAYALDNILCGDEISFEYQLEGIDKTFAKTNKMEVGYTNLLPGQYRFIIRPINVYGPCGDFQYLDIQIRHYYWQKAWFRWLIFFLVCSFFYILYRYRIALIRREEATKRKLETRIKEIEMVALRSQMNPHFLFNSLNSIKSFIARQEPRKATNFLSKFAQLMRYILANSEQSAIPLSKEIDAIKLYLDLESMRFSNKFDYEIKIAPDVMVESIVIQPLILQPYIENAIWHGLLPLESKGRIEIAIDKQEDMLRITIYDNGIGRKASLLLQKDSVRKRKSYGIRITSDRIKHFSEKSSVQILDMQDEQGELRGTKVVIVIPIRFVTKDEE